MMAEQDKLVKDQPPEMPSEGGPLADYGGRRPPAPDWFETAISARYETDFLDVGGVRVHFQKWGKRTNPGLLLVHGNGAHAHWWDFIAPYFSERYNVVAVTFSGMGDSAWRDGYDLDTFTREQLAVAEASGMFDHAKKPIIVAHSFGGFVTMNTGAKHGHRLGGTVIVDSPVNPPDREHRGPPRSSRPNKVYPTLEAALARFRLAPPQPCENHFAMDYIARWSLKKVDGDRSEEGWTWKFDPSIWRRFESDVKPAEMLKATACRIAIIRGEDSALMPDDVGDYMQELLGHDVPYVSIPHARHHVMLDQPLAFVAALRMLLAEWDHSSPNRIVSVNG
ncbi:MAG: alpha/beta hydrolase [Pseudomonadota bacterium]